MMIVLKMMKMIESKQSKLIFVIEKVIFEMRFLNTGFIFIFILY
jgi:hypothetical protein